MLCNERINYVTLLGVIKSRPTKCVVHGNEKCKENFAEQISWKELPCSFVLQIQGLKVWIQINKVRSGLRGDSYGILCSIRRRNNVNVVQCGAHGCTSTTSWKVVGS
jgi:hypothetical protein